MRYLRSAIVMFLVFVWFMGSVVVFAGHSYHSDKDNCVARAAEIEKQMLRDGYVTRFVFGMVVSQGTVKGAHAWIQYREHSGKPWKTCQNYRGVARLIPVVIGGKAQRIMDTYKERKMRGETARIFLSVPHNNARDLLQKKGNFENVRIVLKHRGYSYEGWDKVASF